MSGPKQEKEHLRHLFVTHHLKSTSTGLRQTLRLDLLTSNKNTSHSNSDVTMMSTTKNLSFDEMFFSQILLHLSST